MAKMIKVTFSVPRQAFTFEYEEERSIDTYEFWGTPVEHESVEIHVKSMELDIPAGWFIQSYPDNGAEMICGIEKWGDIVILVPKDCVDGDDLDQWVDNLYDGIPDEWQIDEATGW